MKRLIIVLFLFMLVFPCILLQAKNKEQPISRLDYLWGSKKIENRIWAIDSLDLEQDGIDEVVFATRDEIQIGNFLKKKFKSKMSCALPSNSKAAKLYSMDLDDDKRDEIIVTAILDGYPYSVIYKLNKKKCDVLKSGIPSSLRVIEVDKALAEKMALSIKEYSESGKAKVLLSQLWSSENFFTGNVEQVAFQDGKIKKIKKLKLPWNTKIYGFTPIIFDDDRLEIVIQTGHEKMTMRELKGKKFKRTWRSPRKVGGSANFLPATQRRVLGSETSQIVVFDLPPISVRKDKALGLLVVNQTMPVYGIVGRKPYISAASVLGFKSDEVLGFVEKINSVDLPGPVIDWMIVTSKDVPPQLYVLVQEGGSFLAKDTTSMIIAFDLNSFIE